MDGTLFDSESMYCRAFQEAFLEQGGKLSREQYDRECAGTTNDAIEQRLAERAPPGFDPSRFNRRWREHFDASITSGTISPFPGVRELLVKLQRLGIPVALGSSSERSDIDRLLDAAGLSEFFPVRAGCDEVVQGKPDPEIFLLAARRIQAEPTSCVVIEDSKAGVLAAHRAGMEVILVHGVEVATSGCAEFISCSVMNFKELLDKEFNRLIRH